MNVSLPKSGHAPVFYCFTGTYGFILVMFLRFVLPKAFWMLLDLLFPRSKGFFGKSQDSFQ